MLPSAEDLNTACRQCSPPPPLALSLRSPSHCGRDLGAHRVKGFMELMGEKPPEQMHSHELMAMFIRQIVIF